MAFDINTINGFGTGSLGASTGEFGEGFANSYAHVSAVGTNSITIDTATKMDGLFETFTEGTEILFHVSAAANSTAIDYLGRWTIATITAVNDNILTLDVDISQIIPPDSFGEYFCQVVTVAHFTTLTLADGTTIKPFPYNTTNNYGGILALKCSEMLTFDGGHIDLTAAGIPLASKALRPEFAQETEVGGHGATHAGWENFITRDRLLLNCPDGAIFISARTVKFNEASRVGNLADVGTLRKRAGSSYQHIQGGSTIFLAADEITDFTPKLISKKTSNTGTNARGFARCFIASNTPLPVDEGLYSFDRFANPLTPMEIFNVRDFGNGTLGNATDITVQLNNYAKVTAISSDRQKLTYSGKTTGGLAQINRGALVMVHATHKATGQGIDDTGKFIVATVLADDGTDITIDAPAPDVNLADSYVQIVSIPQFDNFTLAGTNSATPYFDGSVGGIFALAVKNHCDLSGGDSYGNGNDVYFDEILFYEGVALHSEDFTPPTDDELFDLKMQFGHVHQIFAADVETELHNLPKGWRYHNAGDADLLEVDGSTLRGDYSKSVTGLCFSGGSTSQDCFNTPAGLKEVWIRFDLWAANSPSGGGAANYRIGQYNSSTGGIIGISRCLLHIKSHATNGLCELNVNGSTVSTSGNINGGRDLDRLCIWAYNRGLCYFSNVIVSENFVTLSRRRFRAAQVVRAENSSPPRERRPAQ